MTAKERKRQAVHDLREVAADIGLAESRRPSDLTSTDFQQLKTRVLASCVSPDQRRRVQEAADKFAGLHSSVPPLPEPVGDTAPPQVDTSGQEAQGVTGFRLRGSQISEQNQVNLSPIHI